MSKKHYPEHIRSFQEEERERSARCLESGKTYVHAYRKDDGTWIRGHCRRTTEEEKESASTQTFPALSHSVFPILRYSL